MDAEDKLVEEILDEQEADTDTSDLHLTRHQNRGIKNLPCIDGFLRVGKRVTTAGILPRYYGELLAWAVRRHIEEDGWESGHGVPPVTRSDWVIQDSTGSIYVSGASQNLRYLKDRGAAVEITGAVRIKDGVPFIEIPRQGRR